MSEQIKKQGYVSYKRSELLTILKPFLGKIVNIQTGIEANLSKHSIDKMTSAKALEKSKANGFTLAEVLITLAIIGVVATMTLPALISNTGEQQAKTGLKQEAGIFPKANVIIRF